MLLIGLLRAIQALARADDIPWAERGAERPVLDRAWAYAAKVNTTAIFVEEGMKMNICFACGLVVISALAGCAQPPAKGHVKDITPQQAVETNSVGDEVRWGGPILSVAPKQDETCFRMLSFFLGGNGEPHVQNQPQGHFLACVKGYYDPSIYAPRRLMTVVGTVGPAQTVNVNNVEHKVAMVAVQAVKLWPAPPQVMVIYSDPWYGPCCGPYMPGYPVYVYPR